MGQQHVAGHVTVALVEDHQVVVDGVRSWFGPPSPVTMVAQGPTIESVRGTPADVLLLDLNLNGTMIVDRVGELCAGGQRVVVFSEHEEPETVRAVLDAGASAFIGKGRATRESCVETILAVAADRPSVTPPMAQAIATDESPHRPQLSEKERLALLYWFQSMSKASVAARMGVKERTVRQYIDRARVKYAAAGRPAPTKEKLLICAIQDGLISPGEVDVYTSLAARPGES
ncbi:LuxR C-terminal-related transcriptional regulator [Nonomuraea sp. MCN248]|uniref:LuxR C-terminal-related transcriptional regulator n=1 Tax=Nonomuraea corallina TaxID=2989783 RepID=A0ABT4SLP3_9ACTN|nr:sigma factor-like helix-turn-helix DNA-binding protein [Nonomuraea corallina]MDA0638154.1 LuxR C-terminal-related transcriptional regulator [Nonomuraea corallina]